MGTRRQPLAVTTAWNLPLYPRHGQNQSSSADRETTICLLMAARIIGTHPSIHPTCMWSKQDLPISISQTTPWPATGFLVLALAQALVPSSRPVSDDRSLWLSQPHKSCQDGTLAAFSLLLPRRESVHLFHFFSLLLHHLLARSPPLSLAFLLLSRHLKVSSILFTVPFQLPRSLRLASPPTC